MTEDEKDPEGEVLPARELMSLITPAGSSLPGLGSVLGGDPTAAAPTPADTPAAADASHIASHAADGHSAAAPSVSDQPQTIDPTTSHTEASKT
jgi:hypothetical protein